MKALAEASYVVPILSEVEPRDGILILKSDLESEDLRIEANRAVQVGNVQIDVGHITRLYHFPSSWKAASPCPFRCLTPRLSGRRRAGLLKPVVRRCERWRSNDGRHRGLHVDEDLGDVVRHPPSHANGLMQHRQGGLPLASAQRSVHVGVADEVDEREPQG